MPYLISLHNNPKTAIMTMWSISAEYLVMTYPLSRCTVVSTATERWRHIKQKGGRAALVQKLVDIPVEIKNSAEAREWLRCITGDVIAGSGLMATMREVRRRAKGGDDWVDGSFGERLQRISNAADDYRIVAWYIPVPLPTTKEAERDLTEVRVRRLPEEGYKLVKDIYNLPNPF
ncbi:hypothetical protein K491DRAFT_746956 [Lophiostoma macrostomum CBS 122681]|uniref:Uncharacterized protein n=1 Tax=Lophiostoma macrostomum CBS 122681 TaxID=1314788 RepID=A0A6A6T6Y2_9PLEO|nr:hypothetical protein K491DRAFT_746956 [Lophiostoma macrostomum CBS 122681]